MRRREVIVHQPMGAMTGQVTFLAEYSDSAASVPLFIDCDGGVGVLLESLKARHCKVRG